MSTCTTRWANHEEVQQEYGIALLAKDSEKSPLGGETGGLYDGVVLAAAHNEFKALNLAKLRNGHQTVIYDIKGIWDKELVDGRL